MVVSSEDAGSHTTESAIAKAEKALAFLGDSMLIPESLQAVLVEDPEQDKALQLRLGQVLGALSENGSS